MYLDEGRASLMVSADDIGLLTRYHRYEQILLQMT